MSNLSLEKLQIHHLKVLQEYVAKYPPYSDFNVLNLYMWNTDNSIEVGFINNNLIIKMKDYFANQYFFTLLGITELAATIETLFEEINTNEGKYLTELKLIPNIVKETLDKQNIQTYTIVEDIDNHDYILSTEKLFNLDTPETRNIRRAKNKFMEKYPEHTIKVLDLYRDAKEIIELTKQWEIEKGIETTEDMDALNNLIEYSKYFNMLSAGVYVTEKLVGFTINELVQDKTAIGHFGKSDTKNYDGSAKYLEHITAKYLLEKGYEYLNHEQDTGILELRQAKMAYKPVYLLKKWKILINKVELHNV
jgi:uncharacterized protein